MEAFTGAAMAAVHHHAKPMKNVSGKFVLMCADESKLPLRARPGAQLVSKLSSLARNGAMRGLATVFVLKVAVIVSSFALIVLAARVFDVEQFGLFSILFSAAGLFSIVATVGQQITIMRLWNEYVAARDTATLKGALQFSALLVVAGSAIVAAGFFAWAYWSYSAGIAVAVTLYVVALSAVQVTNHLVRTAISVPAGDGVGTLSCVVPGLLFLTWAMVTGHRPELATLFLVFAASAFAALAVHLVLMWRLVHRLLPDFADATARYDVPTWKARSFKLWLSNGLEAANQYLDVLLIGFLMSPAAAGAYFVTVRLANAFAAAADTVHMFATRHIPELYFHKKFGELSNLLNIVAGVTLLIVVGGLVVMIPAGQMLLSVFNEAYAENYPALVVQCIGTAAVAAAGSCGSILMFTGHEGRFLAIVALTVFVRIVSFCIFIPSFGLMGAVWATALSFILMAVLLRQSAVSLTGMDGSVVRLLSRNVLQRTPPLSA